MKKLSLLVLSMGLFCSCQQQQPPRTVIDKEVPTYKMVKKKTRPGSKAREVLEVTMVKVTGPEAKEWDIFDRGDAVMKYNQMSLKDKEILFETIARVYTILPEDNTQSSEAINIGIWKEVMDKGVDLSFGSEPNDWNPYLMYIHPIVIAEMTNFFINAKDGNISDEELDHWQKAGCHVINARPDNMCMAAMLARKDDLAKAGIIIEETADGYKATTTKVDWARYRAEHH